MYHKGARINFHASVDGGSKRSEHNWTEVEDTSDSEEVVDNEHTDQAQVDDEMYAEYEEEIL